MNKSIKIGDRINELQIEYGINTKKLAENLNIGISTIYRWKSNETLMTLSQLLKLANYFNCSLDFLVGRAEINQYIVPKDCPTFYPYLMNLLKILHVSRNSININTSIKSSHFVDWNKGTDPHVSSLIILADYLNVTLDYLVGRE